MMRRILYMFLMVQAVHRAVRGQDCKKNPGEMLPETKNCAQYHNCSQGTSDPDFHGYLMECTYPNLFSLATRQCEDFLSVNCGPRKEPKAPCDYLQNQCFGPHCIPCSERFPSCAGLKQGKNIFPGRRWTPYYVQCDHERTVFVATCSGRKPFFHPSFRRCTSLESMSGSVPGIFGNAQ